MEEVPLAYLPGGLTRVQVRAVGNLKGFSSITVHAAQADSTASLLGNSARCQALTSTRHLSPFIPRSLVW